MRIVSYFCRALSCYVLLCVCPPAWGDARIVNMKYSDSGVFAVHVLTGFAVQIVLDRAEQIISAGTGLNSHCDDESAQWCVVAEAGSRDIFINARAGAKRTNLFVKTTLRNYSFDLEPVGTAARHAMYRLQFDYQSSLDQPQQVWSKPVARAALAIEPQVTVPESPGRSIRNANYTKQANRTGDGIAPLSMWDDGRFTYLTFPNNRLFPAVYKVLDDGSESPVPFHAEDGGLMVVHEVDRRFVLRDGTAAVGLWNEAYDPDGVPPHNGTTVDGVSRTMKNRETGGTPVSSPNIGDAVSNMSDTAAMAVPIANALMATAGRAATGIAPAMAVPAAIHDMTEPSVRWGER